MAEDDTLLRDLEALASDPDALFGLGTEELVLRGLRSTGEVLELAIELASVLQETRLVAELLAIVEGGAPEHARGRAAIALGPTLEMDEWDECDPYLDPDEPDRALCARIRRTFERLYRDAATPKLVRRKVLEAAVRAPEPWQERAVRAALAADDADWLVTGVFALGYLPGFAKEIEGFLEHPSVPVRAEALRAAGRWELSTAGPMALKLAGRPETNEQLRLAAIEALGALRPPGAREMLERLAHAKDDLVAETAEEALDELRTAELGDEMFGDIDDALGEDAGPVYSGEISAPDEDDKLEREAGAIQLLYED